LGGVIGEEDAVIKLVDFGFAKRVADMGEQEPPLGTPAYMPPEMLLGGRHTAACDIWSCGVICYIMLCGCPPFQEEDQKTLFDQIQSGQYDFHESRWSHVSPSAVNMISRMLTVNPTHRWGAAKLQQHPWILAFEGSYDAMSTCPVNEFSTCLTHLRRYNTRRKIKGVLLALGAVQRFKKTTVSHSDSGGSTGMMTSTTSSIL
jgi:serine/threonine protein kinase